MIFIVVRFPVKPEHADAWPELVADFTASTRGEEGNLFFDWSRGLDDPNEYVLTEGFADDAAEAHVTSDHFRKAVDELPQYLAHTPTIISEKIGADGWGPMGEMQVD
ncbi:putative quinol monooxygenase [Williamsia deligens]|uniref:Quinol monooxygenase n=1 Tax=Williamsia deligens TaxID=321325 RepID=A0ABW3GC80_9NOCA|nr:putative quinol monooxygenase [Williamsia deligens]MCP2195648.1 Quinol monooxygenase YgiN [Williamsia deligens]